MNERMTNPQPDNQPAVCSRCQAPLPAGEQYEFSGALVCERCQTQLAARTLAGLAGLADLPLK
jgi:hypothetical protein